MRSKNLLFEEVAESEFRLAEKPSKRDVELSRRRLLEHEASFNFRSDRQDDDDSWFTVDTTELQPQEVAESIVRRFAL